MKIYSYLLLSLALATLGSPVYAAADIASSYPQQDYTQTTGQNQYYTAVFDGEGEAAVAAKLTFQNTTKDPISSVDIEIPGTTVRLITAVQEISQQRPCLRYGPLPSYPQGTEQLQEITAPCLQYDYGYSLPYYYLLTPKEDHLSASTKVTLTLPKSVNSQEQFSVLLYYKAVGYARTHAGVFKFSFNTIKMPYDVQDVRVAVNVQEGLYLAGGKAETQYRPNFAPISAPSALPASGAPSESLRDFSQQIAYEQGFVKQTSGLDPWESFTVKGRYASSRFLLILPTLVDAFITAIVGLLVLGVALVKLKKMLAVKTKHGGGASSPFFSNPWVWAGLAGFSGALFTVMAVVTIQWFSNYLARYVGYGSSSQLFSLLLTLSLIGTNLMIFFGVPVYFWRRHRLSVGLFAFGVELAALFLISLIALLVLSSPSTMPSPIVF